MCKMSHLCMDVMHSIVISLFLTSVCIKVIIFSLNVPVLKFVSLVV